MSLFHTLRRRQWVPRPIGEVFDFFADARNLEAITPPWLGFQIVTGEPIVMAPGTQIRYRLSWHGVPMGWTTEIRRWQPPACFVDVELKGPYKLWHHTHRFYAERGGTLMTDTVRFSLPFGIFGQVAYRLKVRADVERIFDYRNERISELFGAR